MKYARPNTEGSKLHYKPRYGNYIGGEFVPPKRGQYFENISPVTGQPFCEIPRSTAEDIEAALDAAHAAKAAWGRTPPAERANILNKIADVIEQNLELLALSESWDNGKPIRETLAADLPLAVDHFRYFAGCIRAKEGSASELDNDTLSLLIKEPLGVVGQIIPWNFPLLMAAWKLAPALAAGNCVVLKPAEQTPVTILLFAELIGHLLPPGVLNIVNGFGVEAGKPLASSPRISKIAFTGETTTGRLIMQYASENLIPVTLELGGKSPNIFFADVWAQDDDFRQKALEGFVMFLLNQGEVCTCPSRALIDARIYDEFLARRRRAHPDRRARATRSTPARASAPRPRTTSWRRSSATSTSASRRARSSSPAASGSSCPATSRAATTSRRPIFEGHNAMRIFQEEIFGPVVSVTRFADFDDAIRSPATRSTASAPACGRATSTRPSARPGPSPPAACGPTATTSTPPTPRSAATRTRASAARTTA
jgi:aldehyde dehydrogenase